MRESKLEKLFCSRCRQAGLLVRKVKWIGHRGAPDRIVMGGRESVVFVELKAPGKRLSPHQQREIARMIEKGALVQVVRSEDQIEEFIEGIT